MTNAKPRVGATRGRPPKVQPFDQRIAITVTPQERVKTDYETKEIMKSRGKEFVSLAEIVRARALASIDLIEWAASAHQALAKMEDYKRQASTINAELIVARREMRRALRLGDEEGFDAASALYEGAKTHALQLTQKPKRRTARLITRLSYDDRETIVFRASKMGITVSDYMRLLVYSYKPGESDWHMSETARRNFYTNIIALAKSGGFPMQDQQLSCPRCRTVLPERFQQN